jgi:predicted nucleic acid-binding protein
LEHYVLDASALLVYSGFEPRQAAPTVNRLLASASEPEPKSKLLMSRVNWGEVYYVVWRERGQAAADVVLRRIDDLPIKVVDPDRDTTKLAANLKATHALGYADAFAAALAQRSAAKLVAADRDFDKVAGLIGMVQLLP